MPGAVCAVGVLCCLRWWSWKRRQFLPPIARQIHATRVVQSSSSSGLAVTLSSGASTAWIWTRGMTLQRCVVVAIPVGTNACTVRQAAYATDRSECLERERYSMAQQSLLGGGKKMSGCCSTRRSGGATTALRALAGSWWAVNLQGTSCISTPRASGTHVESLHMPIHPAWLDRN
jgi:hypothetical protein